MPQVAKQQKPVYQTKRSGHNLTVKISNDEMVANFIVEQENKESTFDVSVEELTKILEEAGVVYGINKENLQKLSSEVVLNKPFEIARGTSPGKGNDSSFELLFETADNRTPAVGDDGYIDYKNLNLIKNATKGQPLAKKIPATAGDSGCTVSGNEIPSKVGKDRALPKGKNTEISPDNPDLLIATKDGSIMFASNLISIDDAYSVNSDVDTSTGNIDFVGSLKISGNVKAGFIVKAAGNIEIGKNIEDATILSKGSVLATGGFVSSGKGGIKATEDVFVKYVENGNIVAGHDVNIGGGSMNATIIAGNAVILKGNKAVIVGGDITACNLIEAGTIGSEFGTPTLVRVGYSQALMKKINDVANEIKRLESDGERIKQAMYSLLRLEMDNKLSPEKKVALNQLKEHRDNIPGQIKTLNEQKEELLNKLNENKKAKIVVRKQVFPGTIIQIGTLKKEINKTISNCTFRAKGDQVIVQSN